MGAAFAGEPLQGWFRQVVPYAMWARINGQMYPEPYVNSRVAIWRYAWSLAQQKPWTGWGLQTFSQLYQAHAQIYLGHAHNLLLMLSAEVGIPTTLIFITLVGSIMFRSVRDFMKVTIVDLYDRQILFGYILAFSAFIAFNTVDVTVFDLRLNAIAWVLLGALGVSTSRLNYRDRHNLP
jgi:O-antigen ligase